MCVQTKFCLITAFFDRYQNHSLGIKCCRTFHKPDVLQATTKTVKTLIRGKINKTIPTSWGKSTSWTAFFLDSSAACDAKSLIVSGNLSPIVSNISTRRYNLSSHIDMQSHVDKSLPGLPVINYTYNLNFTTR